MYACILDRRSYLQILFTDSMKQKLLQPCIRKKHELPLQWLNYFLKEHLFVAVFQISYFTA